MPGFAIGVTRATLSLPAGSGDISVDHQFADQDSFDCYLAADSPCINAGTEVEGLHFDDDRDLCTGAWRDTGADERSVSLTCWRL